AYLYRHSNDEDRLDFNERKKISYVPAFATAGILEVKNSIYQRLCDITRNGGTLSYQNATKGLINGVDLLGASMDTFIGLEVLPELLFMQRVGIYVDMQPRQGPTVADNLAIRPYLYTYKIEDILSWSFDDRPNTDRFRALLLRDHTFDYESDTFLPKSESSRYRYYYKNDNNTIGVKFYNDKGAEIDSVILEIPEIPFVMPDLGLSLLKDIDNYQIALTNLASTDMQYCRDANFPFYTEQFDGRLEAMHLQKHGQEEGKPNEVKVGSKTGRMYPKDLDRPGFVHPSAEPLEASMKK